jgi:2-hydroxychromene-2-carboxylate isomerase
MRCHARCNASTSSALVDVSLARGPFGSPTFEIASELLWGHDRLPRVERWLERGGF